MSVRTLHAYIGMLIAPTVLFFAMTGLLQIYGFHEAHPGYAPPPLIAKLSAVHTDQHFIADHDHGGPHEEEHPASAGPNSEPLRDMHGDEHEGPNGARKILKAFFAAVAIGLFLSTLAGVWMALQQPLRRRTYLALLLLGAVVPTALAALST